MTDSGARGVGRCLGIRHAPVRLLDRGQIRQTEATFCLLDQRTFECHWSTLERLAKYKGDGKTKVELFYFLAVRWLRRALSAIERADVLRNWWGRDDWPTLKDLTANQIKEEIVKRLKMELGYKWAVPWPIYKQAGNSLIVYYMIHATDHPEAPKLMARAYNDAIQSRGLQLCLPGMLDSPLTGA
jgi:three-Cys-motif partner protein